MMQMDSLTLSYSGYGITAAYSTLATSITYLAPMQASKSGKEQLRCSFEDFNHRCVGDICPGQISDNFTEWYTNAWAPGNISHPWR